MPPKKPKPLSERQRKAIHAACHTLGIDDDGRHGLAKRFSAGRTSSTTRLYFVEASQLLTELAQRGAPVPTTGRRPVYRTRPGSHSAGPVAVLASPAQHEAIERLREQIAWRSADGYQRWLRASYGLDRVKTKEQAIRVTEGLKGLLSHGHAAAH